jgi:hypothetical protein
MTKYYSIFLAVGLLIGHAAVGAVVAVNYAIRLVNDLIKDASPYLWRVVERGEAYGGSGDRLSQACLS